MLAGLPASFKTMIALNAIVNMKIPTLAFSTDSSEETVRARLLSLATSQPTETTETWAYSQTDRAAQALAAYDFVQWDFSPNPETDDIWLSTYAYAEVHGVWPQQIVVDIISDVASDAGSGDEWAFLREFLRRAKALARDTGAHVLLVHHASDSERTKRPCPRRSDIHGKIAAIPELIVTCGMTDQGRLHVACVKNRHAKADKDASDHFPMQLHAERAFVGDYVSQPHAYAGWQGEDW